MLSLIYIQRIILFYIVFFINFLLLKKEIFLLIFISINSQVISKNLERSQILHKNIFI